MSGNIALRAIISSSFVVRPQFVAVLSMVRFAFLHCLHQPLTFVVPPHFSRFCFSRGSLLIRAASRVCSASLHIHPAAVLGRSLGRSQRSVPLRYTSLMRLLLSFVVPAPAVLRSAATDRHATLHSIPFRFVVHRKNHGKKKPSFQPLRQKAQPLHSGSPFASLTSPTHLPVGELPLVLQAQ